VVAALVRQGLFVRTIGRRILHYQSLGSTMDEAEAQARAGAQEGTVVLAETQTGGRGRFGRRWASPPGNIYMSVVLRPPPEANPLISVMASLAVARAISQAAPLKPRIKWPNDVLIQGKKVSGILVEGTIDSQGRGYSIVGIGVNVESDPSQEPGLEGVATSLTQAAGTRVPRLDVLKHLLQELDSLYHGLLKGESPVPAWRQYLDTLGKRVTVRWLEERYHGLAEEVDSQGNLLLRLDDGRLITLPAGEVSSHG